MVKPLCLNFRVITALFSGVRSFRNFTVYAMSLAGVLSCHGALILLLAKILEISELLNLLDYLN